MPRPYHEEAGDLMVRMLKSRMFMLSGEWITGGEGECPCVFNTQGFEKRNSLERRVIMRKTRKGQPIRGGVAWLVSDDGYCDYAPAILEMFAWSARCMEYRLHDNYRVEQQAWVKVNLKDLNCLANAYAEDDEVPEWTEATLLKRLGHPPGKKVYVIGEGKLMARNLRLSVSRLSRAARDHIWALGGEATAKKLSGKKRKCDQDQDIVTARDKRSKNKQDESLQASREREGHLPSMRATCRLVPIHLHSKRVLALTGPCWPASFVLPSQPYSPRAPLHRSTRLSSGAMQCVLAPPSANYSGPRSRSKPRSSIVPRPHHEEAGDLVVHVLK